MAEVRKTGQPISEDSVGLPAVLNDLDEDATLRPSSTLKPKYLG